jgi:4-hydroxybenzoate polyprenyltransferase
MRLLTAFLKLIRLPNLIFIALAQCLFQFCVFYSLYTGSIPAADTRHFILLVLASLFIAAAGYIINDYFDINIDEINKPGRMVVDKHISRRWAIAWHFMLSFSGVLLTAFAVPVFKQWYLILANIFCVVLLWFYSTNFKKQLLLGNIVISLLTAWTKVTIADAVGMGTIAHYKFFRVAFLYAGFAFISSLIREAIKDIEDMAGDEKHGCRTMPIAWGVQASKVYIAVWMVVLLAVLGIIQVYILQFRWWLPVVYSIALIILPLIYILYLLYKARSVPDFHRLSSGIKFVMLTGIVSMIFFHYYL